MRFAEMETIPLPGLTSLMKVQTPPVTAGAAAASPTGSDPTDQNNRWEYQGLSEYKLPNDEHHQQATELLPLRFSKKWF